MRMSVLLAQESDDLDVVKTEASINAPPTVTSKKRSGKKQSRDKQLYGSKDSLKVVNEMGGTQLGKEVDPGECHSLLDEDHCESAGVEVKSSRSLLGLVGSAGHGAVEDLGAEELKRAPQATTDTDDEDDDQHDEYGQQTQEDLVESISSSPTLDPSNLDLPYGTLDDEEEEEDNEEEGKRKNSQHVSDNAPSAHNKDMMKQLSGDGENYYSDNGLVKSAGDTSEKQ
ncbi:unnamed protein product [Meganyctiphanes norvegica]|uniref:Uncharacterized protein n=1 Tax=Meganyctiphanes norvegica TaxID=48144 RepID=A0AAV2SMG8_MEGNR